MEKKWRLFVEDMKKKQRQTSTLNIGQPQELEPDYDDFEDLDENFPIKAKDTVEDFESALRTDLNFKLRLVNYFLNFHRIYFYFVQVYLTKPCFLDF